MQRDAGGIDDIVGEGDLLAQSYGHFMRVKEIDPDFCEVDLHLATYVGRFAVLDRVAALQACASPHRLTLPPPHLPSCPALASRYYARPEIDQIHKAMSLFRKNIMCIFSSKKSFVNLQRVWQFMRHRKTPGIPSVPLLSHPRMWGDNATLIVEMAGTWGAIGSTIISRPLWAEAGECI